jgi:TolB-like protein/DNA-binding winged helix-turn-helix (wHTH) protein/Tfp pilus assembly protein PilF
LKEVAMSSRRIQFGAFELDSAAGELRKHGIRIRLQEQPLQILLQLLEHRGEVVTREELQKRIWPADTFVDFDHGLYSAVQRLRDALCDTAETPRYVETLPRRGYRFIAPVNNGDPGNAEAKMASAEAPTSAVLERPGSRRSLRTPMLVGAGVILVALLVVLASKGGGLRERLLGKLAVPPIRSIAVLPLQNLSSDPNQEFFADGMTDALITNLAQIGSLKVISRTSTLRYKKSDKTIPEIAHELNVDGIVEGTVQRSGDRVRITAQLIHGPSDKHLWANSYERDARNVLSMESEIAAAIANQIQTKLTPEQAARLINGRPINLKAFEPYLQGKYHLTRAQDVGIRNGQQETEHSELQVARDSFEQAIAEDPNYAPAYVGVAETWKDRPVTEGGPDKAREALKKALQLDPALAEAHLALGNLESLRYWNWSAAEREIKRAIELNPNLADAHAGYADYLDSMGRFDEGMREYLRAQELDPGHYAPEPNPFFERRQFDKAIEMDRNDIERHAFGMYPHWDLARNYEAKGLHDEAIREWQAALRMLGYEDLANAMDRGFKAGGYKGALKEWVRGMEMARAHGAQIPAFVLAEVYSYLDDRDHALAWLEKAYEERDDALPGLKSDIIWDNIRQDLRFQDMLRRMNFPQ